MNREQLISQIKNKRSFLCVGLDTDFRKIPKHLLDHDDPIFEFNKQIINATQDLCVAYKPNIAFYESLGSKGWDSLSKTLDYIPKHIFSIADAKRADIGNTSSMYGHAFFKNLDFNAITVSPYMGKDSVVPFLEYKNKWVILLALTSNKGGANFQEFKGVNGEPLFKNVLNTSKEWGNLDNMMFVVGATRAKKLLEIRKIIPNHFLLVPGIGAQGGDLKDVSRYGLNKDCGLLVNSSRKIIYASQGKDFAEKARIEAKVLQKKMCEILQNSNIL